MSGRPGRLTDRMSTATGSGPVGDLDPARLGLLAQLLRCRSRVFDEAKNAAEDLAGEDVEDAFR